MVVLIILMITPFMVILGDFFYLTAEWAGPL